MTPAADSSVKSEVRRSTAGHPPDLLVVDGLSVTFRTGREEVRAVRNVSFSLERGECLAIVGESGSGKSVTARTLVGLTGAKAHVTARALTFEGHDLTTLDERGWRAVRGRRIGLVLQDALVSLDPLRTVGAEIAEPLLTHGLTRRGEAARRVLGLLGDVGVPDPARRARQHPHQLSGGLRQRALIASAIAAGPDLVIADEPTTALDVTVQAQIFDLLGRLKDRGAGVLLISHDLAVVARLADRVAVMYGGLIVEHGPAREVLTSPRHPYTQALLAAVPSARPRGTPLSTPVARVTGGAPPSSDDAEGTSRSRGAFAGAGASPASAGGEGASPDPAVGGRVVGVHGGCPYAARCPLADDTCRDHLPSERQGVSCHHPGLPPGAPAQATAVAVPRVVPDAVVPLIEVHGVGKRFRSPDGTWHTAVDGVSLHLHPGETLGVVGESGSGKTTVARMVLGLVEPDQGTVLFDGHLWSGVRERVRRTRRTRIQAVYQDPLSSFDPRHTVERLLGDAVARTGTRGRAAKRARAAALLDQVGLPAATLARRPRDLSGGQRQRVAIARALAPAPDVLVCDEPVSALDVSIQAQILDLLVALQRDLGLAMLFISHDLGVIHHVSDRVVVMKDGKVVETGEVEKLFRDPAQPYTKELLAAVPVLPGVREVAG
ncbi:dipeptide ABC transporter ATP-binding protein [Sinosporangium siamense]|uniref:ABC transporter domain-containing protein n=1 Tax=Sinosporangium siamense TaxID=1367973 RepID=A0A919RPE0_9ACTN|nr:ABC transporter ATP-binding protein [Sinosporangium siamense]GII95966.1 hypothetical protein Ssi02_61970 [Sinosporangium siamense]